MRVLIVPAIYFCCISISASTTSAVEKEVLRSSRANGLLSDIVNLLVKHSLERKQLLDENKAMKKELNAVLKDVGKWNDVIADIKRSSNSVVYVRWGKDSCPNRTDVETVYTGFIGGSWYNHKGGSSKYFCLPKDPDLSTVKVTGYRNFLYGTEFQNNYLKADAYDKDAPCSVCQVKGSTNVLMVPARKSCYPGWKMEYSGNLVGNDYTHVGAYEYVCLDSDPDYLQGGQRDTGGAWMCPILSQCGALPCPPYIDEVPLTCVVCSK